jgi:hypothetical protein
MGKFAKGHKLSKGRPKGSPNTLTKAAREVIQGCAESLGGMDRMVAWVKEDPDNERIFWSSIYTRLVPLDVTSDGKGLFVNIIAPGGEPLA